MGHMEFDWENFKEYVNSYDPEKHASGDTNIILTDMTYGLGIHTSKAFEFHAGYTRFLREFLFPTLLDKNIRSNIQKP